MLMQLRWCRLLLAEWVTAHRYSVKLGYLRRGVRCNCPRPYPLTFRSDWYEVREVHEEFCDVVTGGTAA